MTILQGVTITLETGDDTNRRRGSSTDNHLYLGVHGGKSGGIEFAIHAADRKFDDFEKGTTKYYAGLVPRSFHDNPDYKVCYVTAQVQQRLLFSSMNIDAHLIDTVYLRKNGDLTHADDDAYKLKSIEVDLWYLNKDTERVHRKTFSFQAGGGEPDGLYLGNENGLKVWLQAGGLSSLFEGEG
jgi:hypothetical protein